MKVTINVDCSPDEARAFMGLPDVRPMQEALLKELEEQMRASMKAMSPEAMMNTWLPVTLQNAGEMQKAFLSHLQAMMSGGERK